MSMLEPIHRDFGKYAMRSTPNILKNETLCLPMCHTNFRQNCVQKTTWLPSKRENASLK